ncbi:MAG: YDG domain-containing protein, partial [Sideroxyarcus sp.]|nr:YDG domain-containing protein [Sideroxyarcus sp.]
MSTPKLKAIFLALACVFAAGQAQANGTDPAVVAGQAGFSTQGSTLSITNSPGAIINWQGFSIGASETTRFIQQSAASSVLNRVIGPDPSVIFGTLTSNGRVFLINPSGILFGQGAHIDVAGLVASTLNLSNQDFLAGRLNFSSDPLAGNVENRGNITTPSGGSVYLVGSNVTNSGIINSPQGDVILTAGQSVKIFDTSTPGVRVELTASDNAAVNLGQILAQSGQVGIYGAALRNAGIIDADQVVRDASGKIVLRAKQDVTLEASSRLSANGEQGGAITVQSESGTTLVSGTIEAKGTGQTGGTVHVLGDKVGLFDHASINVSGDAGGGTVLVGGDYQGKNPSVQNASATYGSPDASIKADAITSGNGGKVIVWADDVTRFGGNISARGGANSGDGGFVEISGKHYLDFGGMVDTRAPLGQAGTLLLDPDEIQIVNAAGGATLRMTCLGGGDCTTPSGIGPYTDTASAFVPAAPGSVGILPDNSINQQLAFGNVTVKTSQDSILISNVSGIVAIGPVTGTTDAEPGAVPGPNANTLTLDSATGISWNAAWSYKNLGQISLLAKGGSIAGTGALTLVDVSPVLLQATASIGSAGTPMAISGNGGSVTLSAGTSVDLGLISAGAGAISATSSGSGDLTLRGVLTSTNAGTSSIVLNSTSGTGNVISSGGSISTPGRATIFTNTIAGSSGVSTLVGLGSGNFRYNGVTTGLGTGIYAVYTEQPTITITADSPTAITYGDATPALTTALSGLQNGDSTAQAVSTTTTVAVGGPTSNSGNYTAGAHTLTPSAVSQLGYALSYVDGTLTVSQLALTGSIATGSSVYGAALAPGAASLTGIVSGDLVTPSTVTVVTAGNTSTSGKLKAGSYTGIESISSTLGGTDAGNYTFAGAVGDYTVSQLALTGSIATGSSVYGAALVPGAASFSNLVSGDIVTPDAVVVTPDVVSTSGHLTAGSHTGIEAVSGTLSGADAANYTFAGAVGDYTVSQLALTISATGVDKVYDGLTTATASLTDNRVAGDLLATAYGTASYLDKSVGNGKTVNVVGIALAGTDAGNYTVNSTATTTADITAKAITGSITADNKVYNATNAAAILTRTLTGVLGSDAVSYSGGAASFDTKNVDTGKTVTGSGLILAGADAGNYTVNSSATTTADITAKAITGSITAANKTYDANDVAAISSRTLSGVLGSDVVSYSGGAASFNTKNVGAGKTVTGTGLVLAGADAGNYPVHSSATSTADITAKAITGRMTADNKFYNATDAATI